MPVEEEYLLPAGIGPAAMSRLLGVSFTIDADAPRKTVRTCYDTFDGRLHAAGRTLVHEHGRLTLLHEGVGIERAEPPARLLVAELPAGRAARARSHRSSSVRALTPTARVRSRCAGCACSTTRPRPSCGSSLETPALDAASAHRSAASARARRARLRRGARPRRRTLEHDLGLARAPARAARRGGDGRRRHAGRRLVEARRRARPGERADRAAAARCSTQLLATIEANLPGTLADVDTEFLHDLRVAVRRTRSVAAPARRRVPARAAGRASAREFRWLQQVTGPDPRPRRLPARVRRAARDAAGRAARRTSSRCASVLAERRRTSSDAMARALRSARARALLADWAVFLDGLVAGTGGRPARRARGRSRDVAGRADPRASTAGWSRRAARSTTRARPRRCTTCARRARSCATCSSSSRPLSRARSSSRWSGRSRRCRTRSGASRTARCRPTLLRALRDDVAALRGRRRRR